MSGSIIGFLCMVRDKHKIVVIIVVSVCGVLVLLIGIGISFSKISVNSTGQKKYVSWASKVSIDPEKIYPVTEVVDGDTLKTVIDGHSITVRLLGINTPETVDPRKPVECFGLEASQKTKTLLIGKNVLLSLNPQYERVDVYGRLLAYVRRFEDGLFINEYLIQEGYAYEYTFNSKQPYQYRDQFKKDESQAKDTKKGVWGVCN